MDPKRLAELQKKYEMGHVFSRAEIGELLSGGSNLGEEQDVVLRNIRAMASYSLSSQNGYMAHRGNWLGYDVEVLVCDPNRFQAITLGKQPTHGTATAPVQYGPSIPSPGPGWRVGTPAAVNTPVSFPPLAVDDAVSFMAGYKAFASLSKKDKMETISRALAEFRRKKESK